MIGPLHHVGIAVRNLEAAVATYRGLGLAPSSVEEIPTEGVRAAFLDVGEARLEILESLRPDGVIARFIDRRGEGLHHVAFAVQDIRGEMRLLRDTGFQLVDKEPRPGARGRQVAFVHPKAAHGVLVELVQDSAGTRER
jgi:methylmalonyl-CoA/ethylmalonyl-CoA epimerase